MAPRTFLGGGFDPVGRVRCFLRTGGTTGAPQLSRQSGVFGRRGLVTGEGVASTELEGASGLGCTGAGLEGQVGPTGLVGGCPFVRTR